MTAAIHNSYSAIVPAVYGTATPVIDVGHGPSSVNATAALTDAGSIVVNLGSAPPGAVTYTVSAASCPECCAADHGERADGCL
jgi:hypothetical protein